MLLPRDKFLFKDDNVIYTFKYAVKKFLFEKKMLLVLIENKNWHEEYNKNIFCFNEGGELLWQCDDFLNGKEPAPYNDIIIKDNLLWALNYTGYEVNLDLTTGKVTKAIYVFK